MKRNNEKSIDSPLFPKAPNRCSEPLYKFLKEHNEILGLFFFLIKFTSHFDKASMNAKRVLDKINGTILHESEYKKQPLFRQLRLFSRQTSQNLLINTSDNFLIFLSEIIQEVARKRFEVLRSSERITVAEALQFTKMQDLISFVADRKVNELSYGGLREMELFIRDRLGVELVETTEQRELLGVFIELRNIHTHNRGVVNELFLSRIAPRYRKEYPLGKYSAIDYNDIERLAGTAVLTAIRLDQILCSKFRMKRIDFKRQLDVDNKRWIETIDRSMDVQNID